MNRVKWMKSLIGFFGVLVVLIIFSSSLFAAKGIMRGEELTTFNATTLEGKNFQLGHQGYPMVINFWATWCPPCVGEMPELQKFGERNQEVELYLVSIQESPTTIRNFLNHEGLNLTPVIDTTGEAARFYRVSAVPTTIVVNAQGIIIYRKTGPVTADELERVLGR